MSPYPKAQKNPNAQCNMVLEQIFMIALGLAQSVASGRSQLPEAQALSPRTHTRHNMHMEICTYGRLTKFKNPKAAS